MQGPNPVTQPSQCSGVVVCDVVTVEVTVVVPVVILVEVGMHGSIVLVVSSAAMQSSQMVSIAILARLCPSGRRAGRGPWCRRVIGLDMHAANWWGVFWGGWVGRGRGVGLRWGLRWHHWLGGGVVVGSLG